MTQSFIEKIKTLYSVTPDEQVGFSQEQIQQLSARLGSALPAVLTDYYHAIGNDEVINRAFNRVLNMQEVNWSEDDYLLICEENQGAGCWGIKKLEVTDENPAVYVNYDLGGTTSEWLLDCRSLDGFLLSNAILNGVLGGFSFNANSFQSVNPSVIKQLEDQWQELKLSEHSHRIFTQDFKQVVLLCFNAQQKSEGVFIGSSQEQGFKALLDGLKVKWDYIDQPE